MTTSEKRFIRREIINNHLQELHRDGFKNFLHHVIRMSIRQNERTTYGHELNLFKGDE